MFSAACQTGAKRHPLADRRAALGFFRSSTHLRTLSDRSLRPMCNDFGNRIPYDDYLRAFSQSRLPIVLPKAAPNLEPRNDIWPTEPAPIIRRRAEGVELAQLRWGFATGRPKGAPVINFRSEGRRFPVGRCLVPASHFFEFTDARSPKAKWKSAFKWLSCSAILRRC